MNPRRFDHDEARRLAAAGVPIREIARRAGITERRIYTITEDIRRRQPHEPTSCKLLAEMRRLRATGLSCPQIGVMVDRCQQMVWRNVRDVPLPPKPERPKRPQCSARALKVLRLRKIGVAPNDIAERLGMAQHDVYVESWRARKALAVFEARP